MKKIALISVVLFFAIIGCKKDNFNENIITNNSDNDIQEWNSNLVNKFKTETEYNKSDGKIDQTLFIDYFKDFKIKFEDKVYTVEEYLQISGITEDEFYYSFLEKNERFSSGAKPTDAEIRNAMMKECENYFLLEYICKAAVEIAYLLR